MNDTNGKLVKQELSQLDALSEANISVDIAREEFNQAIATAHRFPRRIEVVVKQIEAIVMHDEAAAKACVYALPRAGKAIVGPSVNFADAIAGAWGNCQDGARPVAINRQDKVVVCEGVFFDLQTNRRTLATATRRIVDKHGKLYTDDMIVVTLQACGSIARRNAILRGVPRPVWHHWYERALISVRGTEETLPERRDALIASFAMFGVAGPRIAAALGVTKKEEVTLDHMVVLQGMLEQLKAGDITSEEMFDPRHMTGGFDPTVGDPLGDASPKGAPAAGSIQEGPASGEPVPAAGKPAGASSAEPAQEPAPEQKPTSKPRAATRKADTADIEAGGNKAAPTGAARAIKTPDDYIYHATGWLNAATTVEQISSQWATERGLRNTVGMTSEQRQPLEDLKAERLAELAR